MKKKCLFYIHNFLESHHYAIMSFLDYMNDYADFTICAKAFYENHLSLYNKFSNKIFLNNLTVYEDFWRSFDIVHIIFDGLPSLGIAAIAKMYDIPYIISFHGGYDTNSKIYNPEIRIKLPEIINFSKRTTVICNKDKNKLCKLQCSKRRIEIIPPTIDERFIDSDINPEINKNITLVGRIIPKKGVDIAIKALKYLPEDYKLYIIGDGEKKNDLQSLATELKLEHRIFWLGELPLEKTIEILKKNFILWHPARKDNKGNAEGIPQIILYAMALGKYIITTNTGSINSVIKNKKNGIFFKVEDPKSLAKNTLKYDNYKYDKIRFSAQNNSKHFYAHTQHNTWKNIYN